MKNRKYYILAEIANFIMFYLFYITLTELWNVFLKRQFSIVLPVGVFLILFFSYFIRVSLKRLPTIIDNVVVYTLAHIVPIFLIFLLPLDVQFRLVLGLFYMYVLIADLRAWFVTKGEGFAYINIGFVVAPAIAYLVADIRGSKFAMTYFFVVGILFMLTFYLRLFFENAFLLAVEKKNNDKMPFDDMLKNDSKLAIPFIIISIVVMVIAKIDALDKWSLFLYLKFAKLIGFLLTKFGEFLDYIYAILFMHDEEVEPLVIGLEEEIVYEDNVVFNVIAYGLYIILAAFLIFILVRVIIAIVKTIMVKKEIQTQLIEDEDMIEIREKIVRKKSEKKEKISKIRRMYKKAIEKNIKKGYELKKYQTPRERADDIEKLMNENIHELNVMYEKDRYGKNAD
ncbi:MAG: hypothetical protein K6G75_08705 [Lachnospiraceae bacterium]|nr:hypothetical protein [Lachnospiraceae bacterium]